MVLQKLKVWVYQGNVLMADKVKMVPAKLPASALCGNSRNTTYQW